MIFRTKYLFYWASPRERLKTVIYKYIYLSLHVALIIIQHRNIMFCWYIITVAKCILAKIM